MYAIRQISTGWFLPQFAKNQSKGGTWLEPKPNCVPRLFSRKQDAKAALEWWCRGKAISHYSYDGEFSDITWEPAPERKRTDMEVVPVAIVVERLL